MSFGRIAQQANDVSSQMLGDLAMARNRLGNTRLLVRVPIVATTVSNEDASLGLDRADQLDPLHESTISSTFRTPGI